MDPECGLIYDDCLTVDQWRQSVLRCCESARTSSRSPIEQLADVSDMMQIDLSEAINYKNGTWKVRYAIGPLTANDEGSDRSKCMLRCQKQMLHRIRAFCGENGGEDCARTPQDNGREQVSFVDETKSTDVEVPAKVPSLQETPSSCEGDRTVTTHSDGENVENEEQSAESNESEMTTDGSAEIGSAEQTTDEEPIVELLADEPETTAELSAGKPETASAEIDADALQQDTDRPVDSVLAGVAMDALTKDNVQSLADELLHSIGTDESNVGVVVDSIVREACCEPDRDCALYAEMCCVLYEKALADARPAVRDGVSPLFKNRLIDTLSTSVSGKGKPEDERKPDEEEHRRRLAASRFLGVLFVKRRLNVYFAVSRTVYILLESCGPGNAESLECLCMLLMTVGPKLKKVSRWSTSIPMKKIYDELERCVKVESSEDAVLPERTVSIINRLLDLKKRKWVN